jgi:predicted acetylornithine/succinylornithine family transaminase
MDRIADLTEKNTFQTYSRYPVTLVRGKGSRVWDDNGKEYLDFLSGIAVCNLGHCHPAVVKAAQDQLEKLIHVSNFFYTEPQAELAELLADNSFADKIFFCNSGAEANEAAIKLARKYEHEHADPNRFEIITMGNSFHGRTFATLSATGQKKFQQGFEPLLPGFLHVAFNDIDALKDVVTDFTSAIMLEPIQGEGGVNIPSVKFMKEVRQLCDERDLLLIFDEVQVGMGRTGKLFAYEHFGVEPDIMTLAKALAGGLPAGAMLAGKKIAESFSPGTHASTFGGNPAVMAAGAAVMRELISTDVLDNCAEMGRYFCTKLNNLKDEYPGIIKEIRGKGLIIGVELNIDGKEIVKSCLNRGLIINCTRDTILRFLPPINVKKEDIDECFDILGSIFKEGL